jgi:hypothetical protein
MFVVNVRDETQAEDLATLEFIVEPEVLIQPLARMKQTLLAGDRVQFRATRGDGIKGVWTWSSSSAHQDLQAVGSLATFTAPQVYEATTFKIFASCSEDGLEDEDEEARCGEIEVHVMPRLPGLPGLIADAFMTSQMGQNWMAPVPSMYPFAGSVAPLAQGRAPVFKDISGIAFVDDPALAGLHLHKKWLVADQSGLQVLPYLGKTAMPLAGAQGKVTALAVRPQAALEVNQRHVVFALAQEPAARTRADLFRGMGDPGACVLHVGPSGAIQLLAGTLTHDPRRAAFQDGPGPAARFGAICGLAMGRDGTVFVADAGNQLIRRIRPDGMVETLAGTTSTLGDQQDGTGAEARFSALSSLTLDPVTQNLYVVDGSSVRKVTRAGVVTTLVQPNPAPWHMNVLGSVGLACHGDHLYMTKEKGNVVLILNLTTLALGTFAGSLQEKETRMGPLEWFSPGLEAKECAALAHPRAVATNVDGMCLVGLRCGVPERDELYPVARTVLLDALEALGDHREALVLVGSPGDLPPRRRGRSGRGLRHHQWRLGHRTHEQLEHHAQRSSASPPIGYHQARLCMGSNLSEEPPKPPLPMGRPRAPAPAGGPRGCGCPAIHRTRRLLME